MSIAFLVSYYYGILELLYFILILFYFLDDEKVYDIMLHA